MNKKDSTTNFFYGILGIGLIILMVVLFTGTLLDNSGYFGRRMYGGGMLFPAIYLIIMIFTFGIAYVPVLLKALIKRPIVSLIDEDDFDVLEEYLRRDHNLLKIQERFSDPFSYAIKKRKFGCARIFMKTGFNINQRLSTGHSYLDLAIHYNNYEAVEHLLIHNIKINTSLSAFIDEASYLFPTDAPGLTPLQRARKKNSDRIIKLIEDKASSLRIRS